MVRPTRFERVTAGTANQCSIQLSYERTPSLLRGRNYTSLSLEEDKSLCEHLINNDTDQKDDT